MIEINEDRMEATANGEIIAVAVRVDGAWHVATWPTPLARAQTITLRSPSL